MFYLTVSNFLLLSTDHFEMPPGSKGMSLSAAKRDVREACDMLMVKPGLAYLDNVKQTKKEFPEYPLFVYQVSGEYAMFYHGAKYEVFDLKAALTEVLIAFRRAGADCIISYFTSKILQWREQIAGSKDEKIAN